MAYQALYRKWRPRTFDEIVGQDALVETLKNQIKFDRIGHAYLFCGTRGTGKTTAAKIMARAVNCPRARELNGNPCNACPTCLGIETGSSMNVFEIDAASNNGVDNIRDIREEVEYPPVDARYKVYIIDEVHMLSAGAFNALLKTLEEPPEYVIFILATTDPDKLPATILSRCQRFDLRRIGARLIEERMKMICEAEGTRADDGAIAYIAELADGSMRDGLSILDRCISYHPEALSYEDVLAVVGAADIRAYSRLYRLIAAGDSMGAIAAFGELIDSGADCMRIIADMITYLRNVLLAGSIGDSAGDVLGMSGERLEKARSDFAIAGRDRLVYILSEFAALPGKLRYVAAKRVMTEMLLLKLCEPEGTGAAARQEGALGAPAARQEGALGAPAARQAPASAALQPSPGARDIDILRQHRDELLSRLHPSNRPAYADAVFKEEGGGIVLVFKNKTCYGIAQKNSVENGLLKLRDLAGELLGHETDIKARLSRPGEITTQIARATDEELKKIPFPVDIE